MVAKSYDTIGNVIYLAEFPAPGSLETGEAAVCIDAVQRIMSRPGVINAWPKAEPVGQLVPGEKVEVEL